MIGFEQYESCETMAQALELDNPQLPVVFVDWTTNQLWVQSRGEEA